MRSSAIVGSTVFFFLAPCMVAGVLPWWITSWHSPCLPTGLVGVPLILAGLLVLLDSIARFAWQGLGTPAPVYPTRFLVVNGLYRYVRNPMYLAVVSIILGQAALFCSLKLLAYGSFVGIGFHAFVRKYEEPVLTATFKQDYKNYCASVPRWIPKLPQKPEN